MPLSNKNLVIRIAIFRVQLLVSQHWSKIMILSCFQDWFLWIFCTRTEKDKLVNVGNASNACNERNTSNRCFGSKFVYVAFVAFFKFVTAWYTGNDDQHHELISSRRSNISTALLRIGHARSRASRWPTHIIHIIKAITNIPLKNRIITAFLALLCLAPGLDTKPNPGAKHNNAKNTYF